MMPEGVTLHLMVHACGHSAAITGSIGSLGRHMRDLECIVIAVITHPLLIFFKGGRYRSCDYSR